jgi:hypothetical protein
MCPGTENKFVQMDERRLHRQHAVALKYITSRRRFAFPDVVEGKQRRDTLGLYYSYQPTQGFGAVRW